MPSWRFCEYFAFAASNAANALAAVGPVIFTDDNFDRIIDTSTDSAEIMWQPHVTGSGDYYFATGHWLDSESAFAPPIWSNHFVVACIEGFSGTLDVWVEGCFPSILGAYHGIGGDTDGGPNPMRDLVAMVPDSVVGLGAYSWVDESGGSIGTPSPPPPVDGGTWSLPPLPLTGISWTEIGRRTPATGTDPRTGVSRAGAGIWSIPIDPGYLRDGKLVIVFGLDAFFAQDPGTLGQLISIGAGFVPQEWASELWGIYALGASTLPLPPLRQRQRFLLPSSHAAQARSNPSIIRARGDY